MNGGYVLYWESCWRSYLEDGSSVWRWTRHAMCILTNVETHSYNYFCHEKAMIITYYEWLNPKVSSMQCDCTILSSVACPELPYLSTICHKRHYFRENRPLNIPYFPAHKTHFFPLKMWPKFDLRLMRRG